MIQGREREGSEKEVHSRDICVITSVRYNFFKKISQFYCYPCEKIEGRNPPAAGCLYIYATFLCRAAESREREREIDTVARLIDRSIDRIYAMMRDEEEEEGVVIIIREYDPSRDRAGTEAVDRECDVGPTGGMSLHADLLGDPVARIRHSPDYLMLVRTTIISCQYVRCFGGCVFIL